MTKPVAKRATPSKATRALHAIATSSTWHKLKLRSALTGLSAHDLVTKGVSVEKVKQLMGAFRIIQEDQLYAVLGISAKTMQRRSVSAAKTLDPNAGDRALRLMSVTDQAINVLGSQDAAERWLLTPAMALDRRVPIDLLQSTEGTQLVQSLLTRMDYGVYA